MRDSGARSYAVALLFVPFASALVLLLAVACDAVRFTELPNVAAEPRWSLLLGVAALSFAQSAAKNLFEEFAWRGYVTPRLQALSVSPWPGAVITG